MDEVTIGPYVITCDKESSALYIYFKPELRGVEGIVAETVEMKHPGINIDFMAGGEPFGLEIYGLYRRRREGS